MTPTHPSTPAQTPLGLYWGLGEPAGVSAGETLPSGGLEDVTDAVILLSSA